MSIEGKRIAILVEEGFEDSELTRPMAELKKAGAAITVVGGEAGKTYNGKHGREQVTADSAAEEVTSEDFAALVIPGGGAPEKMRLNPHMVQLAQDMNAARKTIASICHGAQLLITADILRGRTATCWKGIRDDVKNAGAEYRDEPVVVDGNLISSRMPSDIPVFVKAIKEALSD